MVGLSASTVHPICTVPTWKKVGVCLNYLFFNPTIFTRILPVGATLVVALLRAGTRPAPTATIKKGNKANESHKRIFVM